MKCISKTATANIIHNGEREWLPPQPGNEAWVWAFATLQHSTRNSNHYNKEWRNKIYTVWTGRNKNSLFADDIIVYVDNAKEFTHVRTHTCNLLELVNEVRHQIHCWKEGFQRFCPYPRIPAMKYVTGGRNWVKDVWIVFVLFFTTVWECIIICKRGINR